MKKGFVLDYLQKREGKAFTLVKTTVRLEDGRMVEAITPIYKGVNILIEDYETLAMRAYQAEGTNGKCQEYVSNIEQHLKNLEIEDNVVSKMTEAIRKIHESKTDS